MTEREGSISAFLSAEEGFETLMGFLEGPEAATLSHGELERRIDVDGRELLRRLL